MPKSPGARVIMVVLLLAVALAAGVYLITRDESNPADNLDASLPRADGDSDSPAAEVAGTEAGGRVGIEVEALHVDLEEADDGRTVENRSEEVGPTLGVLEIEAEPAGARIAVLGPDRYTYMRTKFLRARLEELPPGDYLIAGTLYGYGADSEEVEVNGGQIELVSLNLERLELAGE